MKPVLALKLSNGIVLRCSPEHQLRSRGEWVEAQDVTVGTPVYMSFTEGLFGDNTELRLKRLTAYPTQKSPVLPVRWSVGLAELVGYLMADGHICHSNYNGKASKIVLAFGWQDELLIERFRRVIRHLFGKEPTYRRTRTCPVLACRALTWPGRWKNRAGRGCREPFGFLGICSRSAPHRGRLPEGLL